MQIEISTISCGIRELAGLGDGTTGYFKAALSSLKRNLYADQTDARSDCTCPRCVYLRTTGGRRKCRFVIFSDADNLGSGIKFAKYLEDQGLGKPIEVCSGENPNTGNTIRLWAWEIPGYDVFKAYLDKE